MTTSSRNRRVVPEEGILCPSFGGEDKPRQNPDPRDLHPCASLCENLHFDQRFFGSMKSIRSMIQEMASGGKCHTISRTHWPSPSSLLSLDPFLLPFTRLERDLRMIPDFWNSLYPMIYLLARTFSKGIALGCTVSLAFMTYHISFLKTGVPIRWSCSFACRPLLPAQVFGNFQRWYLVGPRSHLPFHSIPAIVQFYSWFFCQMLWLYREMNMRRGRSWSGDLLNSLMVALCAPWVLFLASTIRATPDGPLL